MIDDKDLSDSTLRFILWKAFRDYPVNELLELLEDEDVIVRTSAAKALHIKHGDETYHRAVQLTENIQDYKREIGAFVLGQLGIPNFPYKDKSIAVLRNLFNDPVADVRGAAVSAIGHLGSEESFDDDILLGKVIELSNDPNADVRLSCASALSSFVKSKKVIDALKKLLKDPNDDVKEWAELSMELVTDQPNS